MGNRLSYLWKDVEAARQSRTAVSLHGHTNLSKESLFFIEQIASRFTAAAAVVRRYRRMAKRRVSVDVNFRAAYWTPPLAPLEAFHVEREQIEHKLNLCSLISLTDHDSIEAPMRLRVVPEARRIPVSFEWSVPFGPTEFHLGIHNLPSGDAGAWFERMRQYTARPSQAELSQILSELTVIPQVLIVLNHPLWDLPGIGRPAHLQAVHAFLEECSDFLHAFELGGLRYWKENREVVQLAASWSRPVISGGDRHGCEPSAILNLTNAGSFSEFVGEIRSGHSHLLFMPHYAQSADVRMLHTMLDAIRFYPEFPEGTRRWDERAFYPAEDGAPTPLARLWRRSPGVVTGIFWLLRLAEARPVGRTLEFLFNRERDQQTKCLSIPDSQEAPL